MFLKNVFMLDFYYDNVKRKLKSVCGFLSGIPQPVLSGGQYDKLMRKMHRNARAIGFAVYLDLLERLEPLPKYDADTLLLYKPGEDPAIIRACAEKLRSEGGSVLVQPQIPAETRYRRLAKIQEGSVTYLD